MGNAGSFWNAEEESAETQRMWRAHSRREKKISAESYISWWAKALASEIAH